jgi:hypothetical protein
VYVSIIYPNLFIVNRYILGVDKIDWSMVYIVCVFSSNLSINFILKNRLVGPRLGSSAQSFIQSIFLEIDTNRIGWARHLVSGIFLPPHPPPQSFIQLVHLCCIYIMAVGFDTTLGHLFAYSTCVSRTSPALPLC